MFPTQTSRSSEGAFCNPAPPFPSQAVVYFYHWPLDRLEMTRVATGSAFLSLPFWHCAVGVGAAEQDIHEWEDGRFYGGETGPGLSFPDRLFQGCYHLSPSHLLKIAPTLHRQRQSRQDMARAFIFKFSLLPSKSSSRPGGDFDGKPPNETPYDQNNIRSSFVFFLCLAIKQKDG